MAILCPSQFSMEYVKYKKLFIGFYVLLISTLCFPRCVAHQKSCHTFVGNSLHIDDTHYSKSKNRNIGADWAIQ